MLNRVILMGRITHDLELKQTPSGVSALTFNVAVERNYAKQGEERQTDFITCVAWRQTAEFISRYFSKGRMIALEGSLRTRTYEDKNGSKHYVTEVYVDSVSFTGEAKSKTSSADDVGNPYDATRAELDAENERLYQQHKAEHPDSSFPVSSNAKVVTEAELSEYDDILSDDGIPF